tara:strand:+ start:1068 stop:1373 length:306 start_codon:yes stop_codon:yes gene_type:complete
MSKSITNPKETLGRYILKVLNIIPVRSASGKGFMLYQPHKVTDLQQLEVLVADVPTWKLIPGYGKQPTYNPDGTKIVTQYYIGHATSDRDMTSESAFADID